MEFSWINQFSEDQVIEVLALMKNEWWCSTRELKDVKNMLANTDLLIGAIDVNGDLSGFARVLTDYTYKALIFDVIVKPRYRGFGLGKDIINYIFSLPSLNSVKSFELYCPERLVGFYEKLGFTASESKLLRMKIS
jgi:predicted GNAT family N-acyltransferase